MHGWVQKHGGAYETAMSFYQQTSKDLFHVVSHEFRFFHVGFEHATEKPWRGLGVLLDSHLSLESQVTVVARSALAQLRLVRQLHLSLSDLITMVHALVTSRLGCCNMLYMGLSLKRV